MSVFEGFDFDPLLEDDSADSEDGFFIADDDPEKAQEENSTESGFSVSDDQVNARRTSADFEPDMDVLLLTAQSSMIIEGIKNILSHSFSSGNLKIFSEAVQGIELYMKILERNPQNYKKLSAILATDMDCMEVEKITFNYYKNATGEFPEADSQKLRAFEIVRDLLKRGYCKSLISKAIIRVKEFFLMSGGLDLTRLDDFIKNEPAKCREEFIRLSRYIQVARDLIKSGDSEINKGMKGREVNVFVIRATEILCYYFTKTGEKKYVSYYQRIHDNFSKYYVIR